MLTTFPTRRPRSAASALACLAFLAILPLQARAQRAVSSGAVLVTVHDSSGAELAGAQLRLQGTGVGGSTDERGRVRLDKLPAGAARFDVRRLGFRPITLAMTVRADATSEASITLVRAVPQLAPVFIHGSARDLHGPMAGFYHRRHMGVGRFITRDEIAHLHPQMLTDLFRRLPGVEIVSTDVIPHAIRLRGNHCAPLVWLDGSPLSAAEFDLDALTPESVEAIEVYSGISEIPPQFRGPNGIGMCGVVVVWSRQGQPKPQRPKNSVSASQLAALVASLKVYTANEVDSAAHPDTAALTNPVYPEALFRAGTSGRVAAEFVVDSSGRPLMNTFGVISSTDPAFTDAVRQAVLHTMFSPAVLHGQHVRQVVQEPFTFVIDTTAQPQGTPDERDARAPGGWTALNPAYRE
ncbi:MAG TPA: TonB family protein [Gemmatimonadaceae bacterium]|nr:TonB family protein [Gemmatimonadaceae bacterium]